MKRLGFSGQAQKASSSILTTGSKEPTERKNVHETEIDRWRRRLTLWRTLPVEASSLSDIGRAEENELSVWVVALIGGDGGAAERRRRRKRKKKEELCLVGGNGGYRR